MGAILAAAMLMQTASGAPPAALPPSGKWVIEYEENMCVLSRTYGTGEAARLVAIKPVTFGDVADIVMVTDDRSTDYRLEKGRLVLQPGGAVIEGRVRSWRVPDQPKHVVALEVPRTSLPQIAAATGLAITADGTNVSIVQAGGTKALAALDACEKDLATSLEPDGRVIGDTVPELSPIADPATASGPAAQWITTDDYPAEALRLRLDGTTDARWVIGIDGRVKKCIVTARSDHPGLDAVVCKALEKRGRYRPAQDANGRAIESKASRRVVWRLPW